MAHLDVDGCGWLSAQNARQQLTGENAKLRLFSWRRLRQILNQGNGQFWQWDKVSNRIWLFGAAKTSVNLKVPRLVGKPVASLASPSRGALVIEQLFNHPIRQPLLIEVTDAQVEPFPPNDRDAAIARFGVMFFAVPTQAFTNLRTSLNAGGRLAFVCWQAPRQNPWMSLVGAAIQPLLPESEVPVDPRAPGPFAFADPQYLEGILTAAGFQNVAIEGYRTDLHVADDLDMAIESLSEVGPLARALAELSGDKLEQALQVARDTLSERMSADGLNLEAAVWLVTADRGAD